MKTKNGISRRLLSWIMVFSMILALAPAFSLPAKAAEITGSLDFTQSTTPATGNGYTWDAGTNTLTLNNFVQNDTTGVWHTATLDLPTSKPTTIVLHGNNEITSVYPIGIQNYSGVCFKGDGTLTINMDIYNCPYLGNGRWYGIFGGNAGVQASAGVTINVNIGKLGGGTLKVAKSGTLEIYGIGFSVFNDCVLDHTVTPAKPTWSPGGSIHVTIYPITVESTGGTSLEGFTEYGIFFRDMVYLNGEVTSTVHKPTVTATTSDVQAACLTANYIYTKASFPNKATLVSTTDTDGTQHFQFIPGYTPTVNYYQNGSKANSTSSSLTLRDKATDGAVKYTLTGTGGVYTTADQVSDDTYYVYDGDTYTGVTVSDDTAKDVYHYTGALKTYNNGTQGNLTGDVKVGDWALTPKVGTSGEYDYDQYSAAALTDQKVTVGGSDTGAVITPDGDDTLYHYTGSTVTTTVDGTNTDVGAVTVNGNTFTKGNTGVYTCASVYSPTAMTAATVKVGGTDTGVTASMGDTTAVPFYKLTLGSDNCTAARTAGTVFNSTSPYIVRPGAPVTVTASGLADGAVFVGWYADEANPSYGSDQTVYSFTMPEKAMTLSANALGGTSSTDTDSFNPQAWGTPSAYQTATVKLTGLSDNAGHTVTLYAAGNTPAYTLADNGDGTYTDTAADAPATNFHVYVDGVNTGKTVAFGSTAEISYQTAQVNTSISGAPADVGTVTLQTGSTVNYTLTRTGTGTYSTTAVDNGTYQIFINGADSGKTVTFGTPADLALNVATVHVTNAGTPADMGTVTIKKGSTEYTLTGDNGVYTYAQAAPADGDYEIYVGGVDTGKTLTFNTPVTLGYNTAAVTTTVGGSSADVGTVTLGKDGKTVYTLDKNGTGSYHVTAIDDGTYDVYVDGVKSGSTVKFGNTAALACYTVTYDAGGAATGTAPAAAVYPSGAKIPVPGAGDLAKEGCSFIGWNDGTSTYSYGGSYTVSKAITLTAQWAAIADCEAKWSSNGTNWTYGTVDQAAAAAKDAAGGLNIVVQKSGTLSDNLTLDVSKSLTVEKGATLTVANGKTLTDAGSFANMGTVTGTVVSNGKGENSGTMSNVTVGQDGTFENLGTIADMTNSGVAVNNSGTVNTLTNGGSFTGGSVGGGSNSGTLTNAVLTGNLTNTGTVSGGSVSNQAVLTGGTLTDSIDVSEGSIAGIGNAEKATLTVAGGANNNGTIDSTGKLLCNIVAKTPLTFSNDATLDLNGHSIVGADGQFPNVAPVSPIDVTGGKLTVIDSSANQGGSIRGGDGLPEMGAQDAQPGAAGITVENGAQLLTNSGTSVTGGTGGTGDARNGGNGGAGILGKTGAGLIEVNGSVSGGVGGEAYAANAVGGQGGDAVHSAGAVSLCDTGDVTGGTGGAGNDGTGGNGGYGVYADGDIVNDGSIKGGNGGNGAADVGVNGKPTNKATLNKVVFTLKGNTKTAGADTVASYEVYTAKLAAEQFYALPEAITVTTGSKTLHSGTDYTWTRTPGATAGTVQILEGTIKGRVTITVTAALAESVTVSNAADLEKAIALGIHNITVDGTIAIDKNVEVQKDTKLDIPAGSTLTTTGYTLTNKGLITVTGNLTGGATNVEGGVTLEKPAAAVNYADETLTNLAPNTQYVIKWGDGENETVTVTTDSNGKTPVTEAMFGKSLTIGQPDITWNGKTVSAPTQVLPVAARPATPSMTAVNASVNGGDGSLAGLTDGTVYQIREKTGNTWGDWADVTPSGDLAKPAGTYQVRVKATEDAPASLSTAETTVKQPAATPAVITPDKTDVTVTVPASDPALEYVIDQNAGAPVDWSNAKSGTGKDLVFDGLTAQTTYDLHYRVKETNSTLPSTAQTVSVTTDKTHLTITGLTASDAVYDGKQHTGYTGTPVTKLADGTNQDAQLVYTYTGSGDTAYGPAATAPTEPGNYVLQVEVAGAEPYSGSTKIPFIISKIQPTGSPTYKTVSEIEKTLADTPITAENIKPAGTIKWVDANGNELSPSTPVTANTSYAWKFVPTDTAHYETLTGSAVLYPIESVKTAEVSDAVVIVDGKAENVGKVTTATNADGTKTNTVAVDSKGLENKVSAADTGSSVVVNVPESTGAAKAQLVVKDVETMAAKEMTLEVKSGDVTYTVPATAIDTASVARSLGATDTSKVPVTVTITPVKQSEVTVAKGTQVADPVKFEIAATYNGKTTEIDTFSGYVSRIIEIPADVAVNKITTGIRIEDGEHIPTEVFQQSGRYYAKINALTNSTYTVIWNEAKFPDTAGKWYEQAVTEMASREVIFGKTSAVFAGDASITRAEFAAILTRALGLPDGISSSFPDVTKSAWCYGSVSAAVKYGIIQGYTDGSFKPDKNITREEAMAMMQRAAKVTGYTGATGSLAEFSDVSKVGAWAKSAVAFNVGSGLIEGNAGKLNPKSSITRAETAVVVLRVLQKAKLIDVRTKV